MKNEITSYRDLPVGKWADIQAVCKDESREELDRQVAVLAILGDLTDEEVLELPLAEYRQRVVDASFLTSADDAVSPKAAKQYVCEPFLLVPVLDARKITTAQYIDFQEYANKGDAYIVEALSCLLVPKGCRYMKDYDITQVQTAIRGRMSTYDAMGLLAFFLSRYAQSLRHFLSYSEREADKVKNPTIRESLKAKARQIRETLSRTAGAG